MLTLQNISYLYPGNNLLFSHINLSVNNGEKVALIGNNGCGKSTLLKIIAGQLQPSGGQFTIDTKPYYIPQIFGQYNDVTISKALNIETKINALQEILNGNTSEENYELLEEDWTIEERLKIAFEYWQLPELDLSTKMKTLSGGEKTKVFLAGISIHQPKLILLDEPSNHLDISSRKLLYDLIDSTKSTLIIVSHDRKLLNLLDAVCELNKTGIRNYGGNYDFYSEQKIVESNALSNDIQHKEKALRKAKEHERQTMARQQRMDNRGKRKQEKAGVARIMMNTLRNSAEESTSKIKARHAGKIESISKDLQDLRTASTGTDKMKLGFDHSTLHNGKILFKATDVNFTYHSHLIWKHPVNFEIISGERIALKGSNGSGKTTLIKLMLDSIEPYTGDIYKSESDIAYIDQDYSLIDDNLKVDEQVKQFNRDGLLDHEIKIRLNRFLFTKEDWNKPCKSLSGGERMRLALCCLATLNKAPDIIILDEPTNNLDIQNVEILTAAINDYMGTLIAVSHDEIFLEQIGIQRTIEL